VTPNPNDLLEEGLARIAAGETDVDGLLAEQPAAAEELRPLLEAALAVHQSVAVTPDPNYARLARAQFAARVQAGPPRPWWQKWSMALRPVAIALLTVVIVGSVAGGSVAASQEALPGEPLYPIKRVQESARLVVARDDLERATLRARFAERRLRELRQLDVPSTTAHGDELAQQIADHMRAVALAVERDRQADGITPETREKVTRLRRLLRQSALHDPEILQSIAARLPPPRRPFMMRMLNAAQQEYERTLEVVEPAEAPASEDRPARRPGLRPGIPPVPPSDRSGSLPLPAGEPAGVQPQPPSDVPPRPPSDLPLRPPLPGRTPGSE
jgi:hypothetical protein